MTTKKQVKDLQPGDFFLLPGSYHRPRQPHGLYHTCIKVHNELDGKVVIELPDKVLTRAMKPTVQVIMGDDRDVMPLVSRSRAKTFKGVSIE